MEHTDATLRLSSREIETVDAFSRQIDLNDRHAALHYGAACQNRYAQFTDWVWDSILHSPLGDACDAIDLLADKLLEQASPEALAAVLEDCRNQLLHDTVLLQKLEKANDTYCKELTMYCLAGQQAIALAQGTPCSHFEVRLKDLELTRELSLRLRPLLVLLKKTQNQVLDQLDFTLQTLLPQYRRQETALEDIRRLRQEAEAARRNTVDTLTRLEAERINRKKASL